MTVEATDVRIIADQSVVAAPRVSVVVSTLNRPEHLRKLIHKLESQTISRDAFEVVVVDDGSTVDASAALGELARTTQLSIRAFRLSSTRGQAVGRNVGWRYARAPVIAFTDDDCAPTEDWLERGLGRLGPGAVLVGRTLPDPELPRGPFSRTIHHEDARWIATCNVFYWREDLEAVGGFDEAFGSLGCEDTDLGLRVCDALDRKLCFGEDVLVYHDVRPSRFMDALRETQRWTSAARLFRSHPRARKWLQNGIFWHPSHPRVLAATVGVLGAVVFPPALLLVVPWFRLRTKSWWRVHGGRREVYAALPGVFLVDLAETVALVRGSLRYRTLVI